MARKLTALLNGRIVGAIEMARSGAIKFSYAQDWLDWEYALPVSLSLPLQEQGHQGAPVIAYLENLELMRWMPPPAGIVYHDVCGCPLFGKHYLRFSAGSSIGRVSGLTMWPSMTPRAGMLFGRLGSHRFRELQALEPRV